jgi:hypothetical protein
MLNVPPPGGSTTTGSYVVSHEALGLPLSPPGAGLEHAVDAHARRADTIAARRIAVLPAHIY